MELGSTLDQGVHGERNVWCFVQSRTVVPLRIPEPSGFTSSSRRHLPYKVVRGSPSLDHNGNVGDNHAHLPAYRRALEVGFLTVCKEGALQLQADSRVQPGIWAHGSDSLVGAESFEGPGRGPGGWTKGMEREGEDIRGHLPRGGGVGGACPSYMDS